MCVGLPGRVVGPSDRSDEILRVEIGGGIREINIAILEEDVEVGDWLEIHMGHAMAKLSEEDAQEMIAFIEELDTAHRRAVEEAFGDELQDDEGAGPSGEGDGAE